jgi:hypothetical protein
VGTWVVQMKKLYGWEYFKKLEQNKPRIGRSSTTPSPCSTPRRASWRRAVGHHPGEQGQGQPLAIVYPEDGAVLMVSASGIVKNAPAPNTAKLFMEYLLSREGNEVMVSQHQDPVNKHVKPMPGGKSIAEVKTIRPTPAEIEKGIPEVKELFRETFGFNRWRGAAEGETSEYDRGSEQSERRRHAPGDGRRPRGSRWRHFDRSLIVWVLLIAVLLLLVINPLARLLITSFQHPDTGAFTWRTTAPPTAAGAISRRSSTRWWWGWRRLGVRDLRVPMAWAVSRTDMPAKGLVWAAILGTFIMPNYLGAVAWILSRGPMPDGSTASTWDHRRRRRTVQRLHHDRPRAGDRLLLLPLHVRVHAERAGSGVLGDGGRGEHRWAPASCAPPSGSRSRWCCPPSSAPSSWSSWRHRRSSAPPPSSRCPAASRSSPPLSGRCSSSRPSCRWRPAYSMPLLLITVFLFWLQYRIIARKGFVALTGKGGERRLVRLGPWRWVLLGYCLFVTSLSFFLPMLVVCRRPSRRHGAGGFSLDNLTLRNIRFVLFDQPATRTATLQHLPLRRRRLADRAGARARHRLYRGAAPRPHGAGPSPTWRWRPS